MNYCSTWGFFPWKRSPIKAYNDALFDATMALWELSIAITEMTQCYEASCLMNDCFLLSLRFQVD